MTARRSSGGRLANPAAAAPAAALGAARDRLARAETLFHGALARPARDRAAWLRAECAAEPALAEEVLAFLDADAAADAEPGVWQSGGRLADLLLRASDEPRVAHRGMRPA